MSSSITEKILGNNTLYTDKFYKDVFLLTKSFTFYSKDEAKLYNQVVVDVYKQQIDYNDLSSWRYHKHLIGEYHPVDRPIELISVDNGTTVTLTKDTIIYHRSTREELLKFDYFYKQLVDKYPDQELLIKSIINTSPSITLEKLLTLEDWSIVSYNEALVESQETNLLPELQIRIDNYKVHRLNTTYALIEPYYFAMLYSLLYTFVLESILAIRLINEKTERAHSYHILNYLASHHKLDKHYNYLTKKQIFFLYRNLLYLNNHSGRNHVFKTLIQKLFTDKRVSVVNYRQKQKNSVRSDGSIEYRFNQVLLNDADLVYAINDFTLEDIRDREKDLYPGNSKEYQFNTTDIDFKNQNSLHGYLYTKDLEVNIVDNTNDVRRKLIPMIVDYWGYMLSINRMNFISSIVDPITNTDYRLSVRDMFKLFSIVLHKYNNITLDTFPDFVANRVFKPTLPTEEELISKLYKPEWTIKKLVKEVRESVPLYVSCETAYSFNLHISSVYSVNLAHWLLVTSQADKDINAQLDLTIENLNFKAVYRFDNETVPSFLKRIGFETVLDYREDVLFDLISNILNSVTYNKLGELGRNKFIQESLVAIFEQFNSYSVQLIDKYLSSESILAENKSPLYALDIDGHTHHYYLHDRGNFVDTVVERVEGIAVKEETRTEHDTIVQLNIPVQISETIVSRDTDIIDTPIQLSTPSLIDLQEEVITVDVDQETLFFLSLNL